MTTPPETSSSTGAGLRQELGQDAAHLRDTLVESARSQADTRKDAAIGLAGSASKALGAAADDLRDNPEAPEWMANGLQQVARQIDQLAGQFKGRSAEDLTREASRRARENPGTFLAVAAAAGFAAARLMRAGVERKHRGAAQGGNATTGAADTAGWPADENVQPGGADGGFVPAYAPEGGTIR